MKLEPVAVMVMAVDPAVAEFGDMELRAGTGFAAVALPASPPLPVDVPVGALEFDPPQPERMRIAANT